MLVLSATYFSTYLNFLVSDQEERFQRLLTRTIKFLKRLSAISPTCAVDYAILVNIQKTLFHVPPEERHIYRNEGITEGITSADISFSAPT